MAALLSDIVAVSTAYSPGHVTAIFAPAALPRGTDILSKGSVGAGFSVSKGITTTARVFEAKAKGYSISINGIQAPKAAVSSYVVEHYLRLTDKPAFLQISHEAEIPIGFGLGSSGAGAVSLSYALNDLLKIGLDKVEAAQIAHCADVECKTGLGTVAALYAGGYEIRLKPGAPGRGLTLSKDLDEYVVTILCISPVSTKKFLRDQIINTGSKNCCTPELLNRLISADDVEGLLETSFKLADSLGLTGGICGPPIRALKSKGFKCSVALFGRTVFTITRRERAKEVRSCLGKFPGTLIEANIDSMGPRIICESKYAN
jgi:pantoate kinase